MEPTLHRLLWGPTPRECLTEWAPRPWEVPAVGLPVRVAAFLYSSASRSRLPSAWTPRDGPFNWLLCGERDLLSKGRLSQFDLDPDPRASEGTTPADEPVVRRSTDWEVPPHEAYFLPFSAARGPTGIERDDYALYCDVLLLITAIDGGESILTGLAEGGVGVVPFVDRWAWRSRMHLPEPAWEAVDSILRWSTTPERSLDAYRHDLAVALEPCCPRTLTSDDFERERVDISLGDTHSTEIPRSVRLAGVVKGDLPRDLQLAEPKRETLLLRVGQTLGPAAHGSVLTDFPAVDPQAGNAVLEQIASAFQTPHHAAHHERPQTGPHLPRSRNLDCGAEKPGRTPDLVVLPELAVPQPEARTVRDLVAKTGIASLAGLYWRQLRPVYAARGSTCAARSWFVNEAELALPVGHNGPGPTSVRWYRVRKPLPAHIESGLASALGCRHRGREDRKPGERVRWAMLKGRRWYRFLHPKWGDFTIAICADLLDAAPWHSLRGEIMHLFMVAYNRDVGLFDALTWVRAYENFANVVTVNDGRYGGSVLWTPKRQHRRELAQVRGNNLYVVADVQVPVKGLFQQQIRGVDEAAEHSRLDWLREAGEREEKFKAPPPGFERHAFSTNTEPEGD